MTHWGLLITTAFAVWAVVMAVVIVLQRRSPAATIAWMLVLAFIPVAGYVIYRLIGPQRLARKKLRRRITKKIVEEAQGALHDIETDSPSRHREQLARIAISAGEPPPLRASGVELYCEGVDAYAAIAKAIDAATNHIHVEYYIWEKDNSGKRLRDQLIERRKAGIEVRVIVDGTGSSHVRGKFFKPLVEAGGEVAWFNPVSIFTLRRRRADFRSHRKLVIVDGKVAFMGGMNMADDESSEFTGDKAWRDTHVKLVGSTVRALQRVFAEDWMYSSDKLLASEECYWPVPDEDGGDVVQIVASGPDATTFAIHKMYFAAINQATHRAWLTTPYFVPDDSILQAVVCAAMRGVDVRLIVPAKGDSKLVDLAARSYYPEVIAAGVRIFEYQPRFVHSKTMVIDDDVGIVASANLDNRSFRLDFELGAVIYSHALNQQLAEAFDRDQAQCVEIKSDAVERLTFGPRLFQAGARLLSPLL
ncbi:MAG: cardiolipin synthase [Kofleriaceae bacterium]